MRHVFVIAMLILTLAVPEAALAASGWALPYTLSSPPTSLSNSTFSASFGGVMGTITTTSSGTWTMTVDGQTFASGTYTCSGGVCTFAGVTLLGKAVTFTLTSKSGTVTGLFATHGLWVSAVAQWANTHLKGRRIGKIVSEAARSQGGNSGHGKP